jgi:hypothetical protein
MKKVLTKIAAILAFASMARAEVKPNGTILVNQCAEQRDLSVCLASANPSSNQYLVISGGQFEGTVYAKADVATMLRGQASKTVVKAYVVVNEDGYPVEKLATFTLISGRDMFTQIGELKLDNKVIFDNATVDTIFHTMAL